MCRLSLKTAFAKASAIVGTASTVLVPATAQTGKVGRYSSPSTATTKPQATSTLELNSPARRTRRALTSAGGSAVCPLEPARKQSG